jgi:hypothetical protein
MAFARRPNLADIRPVRRSAPRSRPHSKTLYSGARRGVRVSTKFVRIALIIVVVALVASIYGVLFWSRLFRVQEAIVIGANRVSPDEVSQHVASLLQGFRWGIIPRDALLGVSRQEVTDSVSGLSPVIKSVNVTKELPDLLKVTIEERTPLAIWSAAGQFFFVDERGITYDEIMRSESRDVSLPVIVDERHRATVEQDRVITEESLVFVRTLFEAISRDAGVGVNFFIAPSRLAPDLIVVTNEGWKIFFDTTKPADLQVATLKEVLQTQVKDRASLQYVDLRIPGRVFVK